MVLGRKLYKYQTFNLKLSITKKVYSYSKDGISLIVYVEMQKEIGSVEMSLDILRNLKCKVFEKEIVIQELTKDQKKLFEKIGVIVPNTMGI